MPIKAEPEKKEVVFAKPLSFAAELMKDNVPRFKSP